MRAPALAVLFFDAVLFAVATTTLFPRQPDALLAVAVEPVEVLPLPEAACCALAVGEPLVTIEPLPPPVPLPPPRPKTGLVIIETAAGRIRVAARVAEKFQGLIADVVAAGFKGPVNCFAAHGHMPGSLHHIGEACDFAQRARNRTVPVMYHVAAIAHRWGLRDGCTFRDCGHIDSGRHSLGHRRRVVRVAVGRPAPGQRRLPMRFAGSVAPTLAGYSSDTLRAR